MRVRSRTSRFCGRGLKSPFPGQTRQKRPQDASLRHPAHKKASARQSGCRNMQQGSFRMAGNSPKTVKSFRVRQKAWLRKTVKAPGQRKRLRVCPSGCAGFRKMRAAESGAERAGLPGRRGSPAAGLMKNPVPGHGPGGQRLLGTASAVCCRGRIRPVLRPAGGVWLPPRRRAAPPGTEKNRYTGLCIYIRTERKEGYQL